MTTSTLVDQLAHAWPPLNASAKWRCEPEDFRVDEILGFEPGGEGEHVLLQIQKRDANTDWVARKLARFANIHPRDVSYAGLKDRFAITTQWFSVRLPGKEELNWDDINDDEIELLRWGRHGRKLKRGSLKANRFRVVLKELSGDRSELEQRLRLIEENGVPNYFTEQRFGHNGQNIEKAREMLLEGRRIKDRHKRSLYLSAARSMLFNHVLSERVKAGDWNTILPGEDVLLSGSRSHFIADVVDETLLKRLAEWDIHPSGPLPGKTRNTPDSDVFKMEQAMLAEFTDWCSGLEKAGVSAERRSLRSQVMDLSWEFKDSDQMLIEFTLNKGCYANAVIRELLTAEIPMR